MRACLTLVGLVVSAAAGSANDGNCSTDACAAAGAIAEEAPEAMAQTVPRVLLQKTRHAQQLQRLVDEGAGEGVKMDPIEFSVGLKEFRMNATKAIEDRMEDAGQTNFDPHGLTATTANGTTLTWHPLDKDFPLRFSYQWRPVPPSVMLQGSEREGRNRPAPDSTGYTPVQDDLDMIWMDINVYYIHWGNTHEADTYHGGPPNGWAKVLALRFASDDLFGNGARVSESQGDNVALYTKGTTCALAFAGSGVTDWADWVANSNAFHPASFCGKLGLHRGYVKKATAIVFSAAFKPFSERLKTCGRRIVTGHSQGGSIAELVAMCINGVHEDAKPEHLRGIGEVELFTYAAAATSMFALTNARSRSGIFKGRRFFKYDTYSYCHYRWCTPNCCDYFWGTAHTDPIPGFFNALGFKHPKMDAVGLDRRHKVKNEFWKGSRIATTKEPRGGLLIPDPAEHNEWGYLERLGGDPRKAGQ